jgi:hypothetical protein
MGDAMLLLALFSLALIGVLLAIFAVTTRSLARMSGRWSERRRCPG